MLSLLQCDKWYEAVDTGKVYLVSKASLRNKRGVRCEAWEEGFVGSEPLGGGDGHALIGSRSHCVFLFSSVV